MGKKKDLESSSFLINREAHKKALAYLTEFIDVRVCTKQKVHLLKELHVMYKASVTEFSGKSYNCFFKYYLKPLTYIFVIKSRILVTFFCCFRSSFEYQDQESFW